MGTKLHFRLSSLLLSVFAFVPIASHAQNNAQFDPFVEVGSEKIRARWCLQGQFPIIQTYGHESWRNAGVVRLSPINHTPDCTSNQVVFAEKDKLFVQEEDGELLLSKLDWGYFVAGTLSPRRRGCRYPTPAVEELLTELTELCGATVIESAALPSGRFTVLAFAPGAVSSSALIRRIVWELGEDARPDTIRVLPIYPRRLRAELDRSFYRTSHQSGTLERLTSEPALRALSTVRGLVARLRGSV